MNMGAATGYNWHRSCYDPVLVIREQVLRVTIHLGSVMYS